MKRKILAFLTLSILSIVPVYAETSDLKTHSEKLIYIPQEIRENGGFDSPDGKWSYTRMVSTPDVALFWAPGFGADITKAPDFEGKNMKVDMANLLAKVQSFYNYYYNDLKFVKPGSKADKYKMMVMLDYSLEGTAYGGDYDGEIGALWIAPNRVQDEALNCIAHELGHSFQSQISADGEGEAWGGAGIFEMCSQWMLWQVNPLWQRDERYHLDAFANLTHKAFLHLENIYHSPYVLEMWGVNHGLPFIGELFRQGKIGEDPVMTYKRMTGIDQKTFNDEMWQNYARLVNWDIDRVREYTRGYTDIWNTKLNDAGNGWKRVVPENAPENYGFNVIALDVPEAGKTVTVDFRGEAGLKGYETVNKDKAGWRYGLVSVDKDGNAHYGEMQGGKTGKLAYKGDGNTEKLWLVVMGAPTEHWQNPFGPEGGKDAQWPYSIKVKS